MNNQHQLHSNIDRNSTDVCDPTSFPITNDLLEERRLLTQAQIFNFLGNDLKNKKTKKIKHENPLKRHKMKDIFHLFHHNQIFRHDNKGKDEFNDVRFCVYDSVSKNFFYGENSYTLNHFVRVHYSQTRPDRNPTANAWNECQCLVDEEWITIDDVFVYTMPTRSMPTSPTSTSSFASAISINSLSSIPSSPTSLASAISTNSLSSFVSAISTNSLSLQVPKNQIITEVINFFDDCKQIFNEPSLDIEKLKNGLQLEKKTILLTAKPQSGKTFLLIPLVMIHLISGRNVIVIVSDIKQKEQFFSRYKKVLESLNIFLKKNIFENPVYHDCNTSEKSDEFSKRLSQIFSENIFTPIVCISHHIHYQKINRALMDLKKILQFLYLLTKHI